MKKLFLKLLTGLMVLSLCACGSEDTTSTTNTTSSETVTDQSDSTQSQASNTENAETKPTEAPTPQPSPAINPDNIKVNSISELTQEQRTELVAYFLDAYKNMDMEIIKAHSSISDPIISMDAATQVPEDVAYFKKVMSNLKYIPEYDLLVTKDPWYFLCKAYEQTYTDTTKISLNDVADDTVDFYGFWSNITRDFANEIYDKYQADAPYIILSHKASEDMLHVVEGRLVCNYQLGEMYTRTGYSISSHFPYGSHRNNPLDERYFTCSTPMSYGNILFGVSSEDNKQRNKIPKGSYSQFWAQEEILTPESLSDAALLIDTYKKISPNHGTAPLYKNYLNNAPDSTNYDTFVENINNKRYQTVIHDTRIMYYIPYKSYDISGIYYYKDGEKIPLGDDIFDICQKMGITLHQKVVYDYSASVVYPAETIFDSIFNHFSMNMEAEGLLTKYPNP